MSRKAGKLPHKIAEVANYGVTPVLESSRINIRSASALRGSLYFICLSNFLRQFVNLLGVASANFQRNFSCN